MRTLGTLVMLALLAVTAPSCTQARTSFTCTDNASCRDGSDVGVCQPNGACSFADAACTSGQRYGTGSAPGLAGVCVGDESTDGGIMPPPAQDMLTSFATTDSLPVGSYNHASVVYGGRIYVSGGIVGSTMRDQVFVGTVDQNAIELSMTLQGGWAATTSLPALRRNHGMAASSDYLYVTGGRTSGTGPTTDVLSAPIDSGGNVGAWTASTAMPFAVKCAPAIGTSTHIYVVGGKEAGNTTTDRVLFATASGGAVGNWALAGRLPAPLSCPSVLVHDGYMIVVGGCTSNGQNGCPSLSAAVYSAAIQSDGTLGTFSNLTAMPAGRWHHAAAIGNGFLYVVGGDTVGAYNSSTDQVWAAPINTDHTLGAWGVSRPLPVNRIRASAQVVGNYLFVIHQNTQVAALK